MKKTILLLLLFASILLSSCAFAPTEVPDSLVEEDLLHLLSGESYSGHAIEVKHLPNKEAHTDSVTALLKLGYTYGEYDISFNANYLYDKSNDIWSQQWIEDGILTNVSFFPESIESYHDVGSDHYKINYDWNFTILEFNEDENYATVQYEITHFYNGGEDTLVWSDVERIPIEQTSSDLFENYYDERTLMIDCSYTSSIGDKTWDENYALKITIKVDGIYSRVVPQ